MRRVALLGVAIVLVIAGVGVVTDLITAARAERDLSRSLATAAGIEFPPEVTLSGFPFLSHARSGTFSGATITARGVAVTGCQYTKNHCFAELGATLGEFSVADGFSIGPTDTINTASVRAYSLLNSVNLGRYLGILDLGVNTPATPDRVGGGGPQFGNLERRSGVVLTGTVTVPPTTVLATDSLPVPANSPASKQYPGPTVRVSVTVDLSVRDGRLHLQATDFYTGPEEHADASAISGSGDLNGVSKSILRQQILQRFTTTLPRLPMPWGLIADDAHSAGSDIMVTATDGRRMLRPDEF